MKISIALALLILSFSLFGANGEICGLEGSVDERINDCSYQQDSEKKGFVLVTRSKDLKEVHKEVSTGLLWSDKLSNRMNHYRAIKVCDANLEEVAGISNVKWRLPSVEEYREARVSGIRIALPGHWFWTSSMQPSNSLMAWAYNVMGEYAVHIYRDDDYTSILSVRCVAR